MQHFVAMLIALSLACSVAFTASGDEPTWQQTLEDVRKDFELRQRQLLHSAEGLVGLELVVAAPSHRAIESRWGHAFLRFVDGDDNPFNDLILGFVGWVDTESLDVIKGLTGGYALYPAVMSTSDVVLEYVQNEGRPLLRLPLITTAQERRAVLKLFAHWIQNPEAGFGRYTFLENNCAGALIRILEASGLPTWHGPTQPPVQIPVDLPGRLVDRLLTAMPAVKVPSFDDLHAQVAKRMFISFEDAASGRWGSPGEVRLRLQTLSANDLLLLLTGTPELRLDNRRTLHDLIDEKGGGDLTQALRLTALPPSVYNPCTSQDCAFERAMEAQTAFLSLHLPPQTWTRWRARDLRATAAALRHPGLLRLADSVRYEDLLTDAALRTSETILNRLPNPRNP
jgi:hypothetical protein